MSNADFPATDWEDPFEIDTSVAHPARRYNYWLGGKDNFEADRASGDAIATAFPTVKIAAQENRRFLRRAVTYLVKETGIRQFLDIGTGIPAANNVHEVAQSLAPESRVVYVDNDPIVLAYARRLLAADGATVYLHADLRNSAAITRHPDLQKTLDLTQPVALMLIAVGQFLEDGDEPYRHVTTLADALPPGSYLAMSHPTTDFMSDEVKQAVAAANERERAQNRDPFRPRTRAEFARFFHGIDVIPPGIVPLPEWRNDDLAETRPSAAETAFYGAVARIR